MTNPADKKPDRSRDTSDSKEPVFRLYDHWEARFCDEKKRLGTAE